MKINHFAVYVDDLEGVRSFYMKYFGATSNERYHNPKTGLQTYFLSFGDSGRLEIMTRPGLTRKEKGPLDSGYIHIAFSVGSSEGVDSLTDKLRQDGYTILSEPRTTGDGYYESCVLDPENNQIEIVG